MGFPVNDNSLTYKRKCPHCSGTGAFIASDFSTVVCYQCHGTGVYTDSLYGATDSWTSDTSLSGALTTTTNYPYYSSNASTTYTCNDSNMTLTTALGKMIDG